MASPDRRMYAYIDYEDPYVHPLILATLKARLPTEMLVLINSLSELPTTNGTLLQWRQYESIDFEHLLANSRTSQANSYIIRKALIRKHYLSNTISHWLAKHPDSILRDHVKGGVEFEVDYAEFLDDALVEAWELKESWARNACLKDGAEREWWILKPGMSERGQGIRLFSSEADLTAIFEGWDPESDDEDEGDDDAARHSSEADDGRVSGTQSLAGGHLRDSGNDNDSDNGIMTSQLRHFIAQPYIHPPLLLSPPHPCAGRKFHIRTYVVAVGALKVYVYKSMLALFAGKDYTTPSTHTDANSEESLGRHLTNTCLQSGERDGSVVAFWDLPSTLVDLTPDWQHQAFAQICSITAETFEAAARTMGIHFQALPNAFEIFGLDFLVDGNGTPWLLEVNAFPDFRQTGEELRGLIEGLMAGVVDVAVRPFFVAEEEEKEERGDKGDMVQALSLDLGRR
ncbi:hypothetical protein LTR62_007676 [Meristemomyces frigidus]|uniref:Tubulin-tyrosine ligase n=1 Tax=Meristemomyces frigidus TaxID=1508187 RepID=A0AAN7TLY3_9PEZI|nr:hypothetical protein LTR62_007676 [Meristemomyces frigidus]